MLVLVLKRGMAARVGNTFVTFVERQGTGVRLSFCGPDAVDRSDHLAPDEIPSAQAELMQGITDSPAILEADVLGLLTVAVNNGLIDKRASVADAMTVLGVRAAKKGNMQRE